MQKQSNTQSHRTPASKEKKEFRSPSLNQLYEKEVIYLNANASVFDAAKLMLENHIGNVVIVDDKMGKSVPVGIITDRDIVIKTTAKKLDPASVKVSELMTKSIVTASEEDDLSGLVKLMTEQGISRLPIVDDSGALKGILSSKKIFQYFTKELFNLSSISEQQQRREGKTH